MTDYKAMLEEEFEVLESIFPPDEYEKRGESSVAIRIEPEEGFIPQPVAFVLTFEYPETYPDVLPLISIEPAPPREDADEDEEEIGGLDEDEQQQVLDTLRQYGEENLGIAMTFTLAASARESLTNIMEQRAIREQEEDDRRAKAYEEAEAARTRGTPLTRETFEAWKKSFMAELKRKREKEEEERIKALAPKEREEVRKRKERLSGKALFEAGNLAGDDKLYEDDAEEVDLSKYTREERENERRREEEEEERRRAGLVGDGNESE